MNRFDRIEGVARRHVDAGALASVEWKILREGRVFAEGRYGMADPEKGVALPENAIYRIFSMTKPVVSAVALMLVERGDLHLFDPVALYLPEFAEMEVLNPDGTRSPAAPMTIEHLLTHRAGLSYGFLPDCPVGVLYRQAGLRDAKLSLADYVARVAGLPLASQPGQVWRYSIATDVLARVLEVILNRPLPQILDDFVFAPLGLHDTGFMVPPADRARLVPMFGKSNLDEVMQFDTAPQRLIRADVSEEYPCDDPAFYRGAMGLFSTLEDYLKITQFLQSGLAPDGACLLSRKMVQMMWTDRIPACQKPIGIGPFVFAGYGFGLAGRVMSDMSQAMGLTSAGESGWAGAASTFFWIDPQEDVAGVVMAQYLGSKIRIGEEFREALCQAL